MTLIEQARRGIASSSIITVARQENVSEDFLLEQIAQGTAVIPVNVNRGHFTPCGIGKGLRVKVNANVGTSSDFGTVDTELEKLHISTRFGADAVMDLSTGGDICSIRKAILAASTVPIGTVPIYEAAIAAIERRGAIVNMTTDDLFDVIEQQAQEGVDFMTLHCGITQASIQRLKNQHRQTDVVSRGGAFLIAWIIHNQKENPLYQHFDRLLEIAREHDVTLSLGDGMRPGSLADATDRAQVEELLILGELVDRSREAGVQVMIEGPGHVPLDQVVANVQLEKSICRGAPFYVLGPLVTDIAAGYDHIAGAIGGALAGMAGADFLCYLTPSEHLALPDLEDVKVGVIASRIAAHAADIARNLKGAAEWDRQMSLARKRLDWQKQADLSLDPGRVKAVHGKISSRGKACSMCGDYCAMELVNRYLNMSVSEC